jgi:CBS domain containing-hemolysin-like protein
MELLVFYVLIALGFSFLCSLLEATLLTVTPIQIQTAKQGGRKWAATMERLKTDIDEPLSAILTLNTIAHTMGATGAGAQYTKEFGDATGGIFAAVLTLAVLLFTEIIPKTLGARYALFFAAPTAWLLPKLQLTLKPIVWVCQQVTRLISFGRSGEAPKHREELIAVARLGEEQGTLNTEEGAVVRNILQLSEIHVRDIMTPRPVMFMMPVETGLREFVSELGRRPFTRVPVYGASGDEVLGFVIRSEALEACLEDDTKSLRDVMRPLAAVPSVMKVDRLFRELVSEGRHMVLVTNEFGATVGLVTLEDVIETIVGAEIVDETDTVADLQQMARNLWKERASRMGIEVAEEE